MKYVGHMLGTFTNSLFFSPQPYYGVGVYSSFTMQEMINTEI